MLSQLFRLSKHTIIYGLGASVSQVIGFLLIPLYTRYLTPVDYGTLAIFSVTTSLLSVFFIMGLSSALFRSYFNYDDKEKRRTVLSTALVFLTITSLLLTLLLVSLASSFSSLLFGSYEFTFYFQLIFITIFFNTGSVVAFSVLRARGQPGRYALISVAQLILSVILNILFVVVLLRGVLGILEAGLISTCMVYVILMLWLIKSVGFTFSFGELKKMLSFGLPLIPAGLAAWILTMADRYFLQFLSTTEELGLYSLGYRFGLAINTLLVQPFNLAWVPFLFSTANQDNARDIYSRVLTYFLLVSVFVALSLSVLSKEIVAIMATPAFLEAYKVVPLISMSYVLYGCYFIVAVGINLEAKTKYLPPIVGAAAILNLALNYLLIPSYGMMGAAAATLLCYFALFICTFLISQRFYAVRYEWIRIIKIFLAASLIYVGSVFIANSYAVVHSHIIVGIFKTMTLLTYPILLYLFRFYHLEEIHKVQAVLKIASGYITRVLGK